MDIFKVLDEEKLSLLRAHSQTLVGLDFLEGFANDYFHFKTLDLHFPLLPVQFLAYNTESKCPEWHTKKVIATCLNTIDKKLGYVRYQIFTPDVGDDFGNLIIAAHEEAHAVINIGRFTEITQYNKLYLPDLTSSQLEAITQSRTQFEVTTEPEEYIRSWDRWMILGAYWLAANLYPHDNSPEIEDIENKALLFRQIVSKVNPIFKMIVEPVCEAAMLATAIRMGYSVDDFIDRIYKLPFRKHEKEDEGYDAVDQTVNC